MKFITRFVLVILLFITILSIANAELNNVNEANKVESTFSSNIKTISKYTDNKINSNLKYLKNLEVGVSLLNNEYRNEINDLKSKLHESKSLEIDEYKLVNQIKNIEKGIRHMIKFQKSSNKDHISLVLKINRILSKLKSYNQNLKSILNKKKHNMKDISKCSKKLEKGIYDNSLSKEDKMVLMKKIEQEIQSLNKIQNLERTMKEKIVKMKAKRTILEKLAIAKDEDFKKLLNYYYDKVSEKLGIEVRSLSELNKKHDYKLNNASKLGFSINKEARKIKNIITHNIENSTELVNKNSKLNTKLMALIKSQDELKFLIKNISQLEHNKTRDYRLRAVKLLQKYHTNLKLIGKQRKLKKNEIDLLKAFKKIEVSNQELSKLQFDIRNMDPNSNDPSIKNSINNSLKSLKKRTINVKIRNLLGQKSLKGIEMLKDNETERIKEVERDVNRIKYITNDRIKILEEAIESKDKDI